MPDEAVFTVELDAQLRDQFVAEARAMDRPAAAVMQELMREFVERRQEEREYDAFLARKVAKARQSIAAGLGRSQEEVEAEFAAWRASVLPSEER
jgi:predicted transcriptional regulator